MTAADVMAESTRRMQGPDAKAENLKTIVGHAVLDEQTVKRGLCSRTSPLSVEPPDYRPRKMTLAIAPLLNVDVGYLD